MVKSEMLGLWALLVVITEVTCHYTSQWAAHIEGGPAVARKIADAQGFTLLAEIFPDTYHLEHRKVAKRSAERNREHHENLTSDKRVKWAQQQRARRRRKRDFLTKKDLGLGEEHIYANDARWKQMWYLNRGYGLDMSVEGAWKQGITGKGIVVTILDDGLEKDHPDLKENYDPQASYDVNGHDDDPMPRYDLIDSNRHGTRCAGEVAAVANNSICSLGIAFKASVGGVRMLDGDVTDAVEARSLSLNPQHIDIYSASWGPDDDGKTVDGPGELAMRAFVEGVTKGRGGRGSIFVWASGNGGRDHDNCNCDGYTNSIWTLSISSATEEGYVPWYSEACSSTLATTYSSGSAGEKQIVTTDLHHTCTSSHTGTSASAPLAAGICALALEANTLLTWRDMQHIVVATAKPANLKASDWVTNGVGRNVSHSFGYGLMDATAMVKLAHIWHTVPQQQKCEVTAPHADKVIPAKSHVTLQLLVTECAGVNYLEHVQAKITLMSQRRGDIQIQLTSPAGTKTTLLARRPHDVSRSGFRSWPFMSVHTWGENPIGIWTLEIHNEARYLAQLSEWNLIFYGTETPAGVESESSVDTASVSGSGVGKPPLSTLDGSSHNFDNSVDPSAPSSNNNRWKEVTQRNGGAVDGGGAGGGGGISSSVGQQHNIIPDDGFSLSSPVAGVSGASPSGCRTSTRTCLECNPGHYLWHGSCEDVCPAGSFRVDTRCEPCHYSCRFCLGPNDYECTECHTDAALYESSDTGETFCLPKSTLPSLDYTKWLYRSFWALLVNVSLLVTAAGLFYFRQRGCRCRYPGVSGKTIESSVRYNLTADCMSDSE